jgi:hypothetical protein
LSYVTIARQIEAAEARVLPLNFLSFNRQHLVITTRSYHGNLPECLCFEQGGIQEKIFWKNFSLTNASASILLCGFCKAVGQALKEALGLCVER